MNWLLFALTTLNNLVGLGYEPQINYDLDRLSHCLPRDGNKNEAICIQVFVVMA